MGKSTRRLMRSVSSVSSEPVDPGSPAKFSSLVFNDQFATFNSSRWAKYNNSTFGAPSRIQRYMSYNVVTGTGASSGATGGTSLRLKSVRENVGGNNFTAGMVDTKSVSNGIPLYNYFEVRHKIPHGQGLWPAAWLTSRIDGAKVCEFDVMEYFHSQVPGKVSVTLHRTNNAGVFEDNVNKNYGGTFFENPTYTPGWHVMAGSVEPENGVDATAGVRFKCYLDGALIWNYLDTQAVWWTTHGTSDLETYWNIYLQGCQISGEYIGHPDVSLGYSDQKDACLISGTKPNACTTTYQGRSIIRAGAAGDTATITGQPATTYEIDYVRVWKYTG